MRVDPQAEIAVVAALLPPAYAIIPCEVGQGPAATATRNYIARDTDGRRWFVKVDRPDTNVAAEQRALEVAEFAGLAGVPVPRCNAPSAAG